MSAFFQEPINWHSTSTGNIDIGSTNILSYFPILESTVSETEQKEEQTTSGKPPPPPLTLTEISSGQFIKRKLYYESQQPIKWIVIILLISSAIYFSKYPKNLSKDKRVKQIWDYLVVK